MFSSNTNTLCPSVTVTSGGGACTSNPLPAGTHTITVTYSGDANFQQSSTTYTERVTTSRPGPTPSLATRKSVDDRYVSSGDTTSYTIRISNCGSGAVAGVTMTDPLLAGIVFAAVSQEEARGTCKAPPAGQTGTVICTLANLPAVESWEISIRVKVTAANDTAVTNTASFTSATPNAGRWPYSSSAVLNLRKDS